MEWMNQASTSAQKSDAVFWFVFALSVAFLVFITALMIYFVVRYNKRRNPVATPIEDHALLEGIGFSVRSVPMSLGTPFANVLLVADKARALP